MLDSTAKDITGWISHETGINLTFKALTEGGSIHCHSSREKEHIIVCRPGHSPGTDIVSSLLGVVRPRCRYAWLVTGGPGVNMEAVAGWDEQHQYKLQAHQWIQEQDANYPRANWLKLIENKALRIPRHLNAEEISQLAGIPTSERQLQPTSCSKSHCKSYLCRHNRQNK